MAGRLTFAGLVAICTALGVAAPGVAAATSCAGEHWVAGWGTSPSDADPSTTLAGQTVRTIVTPLGSGSRARVRLSNRFGAEPLLIDSAFVGRQRSGPVVVPGSNRRLRFDGHAAAAIEPGGELVSDPVELGVERFKRLAVSVHVSAASLAYPTRHFTALQTTYVAPASAGDLSADPGAGFSAAPASVSYSRPIVTGIDLRAPRSTGAVVAFGDSITDGLEAPGAGIDADARYPDFLARRLAGDPSAPPLSVVNAGISGNALVSSFIPAFGPTASARLRADVIDEPGVTDVIVLIGRNDFDFTEPPELIAKLRQLLRTLARHHLNLILGTFSPSIPGNVPPEVAIDQAQDRLAVNRWIRRQRLADAVADFDRALRDPDDPQTLRARFASGDGPHLSAAGYRRMARTIDLATLRGPRCASQ